jgi:hypothetical protein
MMLKDTVFMPVEELFGLTCAVWATFLVSGVLHVYALVWAGSSIQLCGLMLAFFVLQPLLLAFERWARHRFGVRVPWLVLLTPAAPLFLEPFLTIAGW